MARLVIVAGPAFRPFRHLPSFCSPQWPGLSLWQVPPCSQHSQSSSIPSLYPTIGQPHTTPHLRPGLSLGQVPPYNQHPLFTSIPSLYPTPVTPTVKARLVIVAGPALQPTPPLHFYPIFIPTLVFPLLRPGLSLWQVPPHQYPPTPFSPLLPSSLTCFSPQPPSSYPSFGPACHCGRSRLVPLLTLLAPLPFWIPHSILVIPSARLAIVAGPASPIPTAYHFNSFYHSHLLPLLKARLVIVAGLA